MTSAERIASTISIIYFSCYIFVFFIASIFCAYEVQQQHQLIRTRSRKSSKNQTKSKDQIEFTLVSTDNPSTAPREEEKYDPDTNEANEEKFIDQSTTQTNANESCFKTFKKFTKYWLQSIWTKKKIYFSIVPHVFDQATDAGVIYTYYQIWSNPDRYPNENQS